MFVLERHILFLADINNIIIFKRSVFGRREHTIFGVRIRVVVLVLGFEGRVRGCGCCAALISIRHCACGRGSGGR